MPFVTVGAVMTGVVYVAEPLTVPATVGDCRVLARRVCVAPIIACVSSTDSDGKEKTAVPGPFVVAIVGVPVHDPPLVIAGETSNVETVD